MYIRSLAALVVLSSTGPASADPYEWSGGYVGAHLGLANGQSTFRDDQYNGAPPFPALTFDVPSDGGTAGLHIGHNWQFQDVILGVEGELGYLNLRGSAYPPPDEFGNPYDSRGEISGGWLGGVSARLGYSVGPTLLFLKGGLAYSTASLGYVDTCVTGVCGPGTLDGSKTVGLGYQVGVGVEHAIADNWSLRVDYSYLDFGTVTILGVGGGSVAGNAYLSPATLAAHTIRVGASYRF